MKDHNPLDLMKGILDNVHAAISSGLEKAKTSTSAINIIFDGPPGPEAGRFVEVENDAGESISIGEWSEREDGFWSLRITEIPT